MSDNTFTCARCGGLFEKDWSDEEAMAEHADRYKSTIPIEECSLVCEDCYNNLPAWVKGTNG